MSEPFYITTAISYPNGPPHIGHAYEAIAADAMARFQRQQGRDVRFQTGTDEHGLKMAQAARGEGVEPRAFADKMSRLFQEMCDTLNVSYDRFIRTSQPDHYRASQAIWKAMEERGDLYLDRYEGWYSVRDEAYYEEEELGLAEDGSKALAARHAGRMDGRGELVLPSVQIPAAAARPLCGQSRNSSDRRAGATRSSASSKAGLKDLSISRTSFDWGVPVPGSNNHVMYVWLDALTNYITGLGYPDDTDLWRRYWPANVHLIGKDVVRFHAVYWPAFLMSAGIALPRQVYGHGFLLSRGEKMSKSVGNVVDPMVLAEHFGVDALRYFLLREVTFGQDGSYSAEAIVSRANAELANSFGNLAQRVLTQIVRNCGGGLPEIHGHDDADNAAIRRRLRGCRRGHAGGIRGVSPFRALPRAGSRRCSPATPISTSRRPGLCARPTLSGWRRSSRRCTSASQFSPSVFARSFPRAPTVCSMRWALHLSCAILRHLEPLVFAARRERFPARAAATAVPAARTAGGRGGGRVRLIDSHCHLNYEGLVERQAEVLDNARDRGVFGFLNISTRQREWGDIIAVAEREPDVWASVGVHPHEADAHPDLGAAALVEAADHPRVIAIGECGLDYYYDKSDRAAQRERFEAHIDAARQTGLPLVVHTRDAEEDTAEILSAAVREGGVTGVLHCFTGSAELARKGLDLGFYVSLSGIVTFKNAQDLQATAKWLPADQMLVETDSPFLAPVPHRGQKCEPAFVADTASFVAQLRGEDPEELAEATTANFFKLFSKAAVKVRILGCGTSTGVPKIGNDWGQCDPHEPRNYRLQDARSWSKAPANECWSIAGPTCASSCSPRKSSRLEGVIVTHTHGDHCHGIDELRPVSQAIGGPVPLHARAGVLDELELRFAYAFEQSDFYRPIVEARELGR